MRPIVCVVLAAIVPHPRAIAFDDPAKGDRIAQADACDVTFRAVGCAAANRPPAAFDLIGKLCGEPGDVADGVPAGIAATDLSCQPEPDRAPIAHAIAPARSGTGPATRTETAIGTDSGPCAGWPAAIGRGLCRTPIAFVIALPC